MSEDTAPPLRVLVCGVLALAVVVGGYLSILLTDHDPTGFLNSVMTLLGVAGVGAHLEVRNRQQTARLGHQDEKLNVIQRQTNGVLDQRIQDGTRKVLAEAGLVPAAPEKND